MENTIGRYFDNLYANDAVSRYSSFVDIISKTNQPVDWVYEVWDELVTVLGDKNYLPGYCFTNAVQPC